MLSGEYLVLQGAHSLAMPCKFGQSLRVEKFDAEEPGLHWRSYIRDKFWVEAEFSLPDLQVLSSNQIALANKLSELLITTAGLNPGFLDYEKKYQAHAKLDFDIRWGLGSSSSLISNIAYWAEVDPFKLHFKVSEGSGYDIACARADKALVYSVSDQKPEIREVDFHPPFTENLFFVYSGEKKDSAVSIADFLKKKKKQIGSMVHQVNAITDKMIRSGSLGDFNHLIREHEDLIARLIEQKPVKELKFPDFPGEVKSLGAWGGDFLMFSFEGTKEQLLEYLQQKSLDVVFGFEEIFKTA